MLKWLSKVVAVIIAGKQKDHKMHGNEMRIGMGRSIVKSEDKILESC